MSVEITEFGLKDVDKAYKEALERLKEADAEYKDAIENLEQMKLAKNCKHENVMDKGGFMYGMYECKDCGFKWMGS